MTNRDKVEGTAKDIAGKVQREVGEATGDTGTQVDGAARQAEGKIRKGVGDLREAADQDRDEVRPRGTGGDSDTR